MTACKSVRREASWQSLLSLDNDTERYHDALPIGIKKWWVMNSHVVAVYGAGGHTGQFVAAELERRGVAVRRVARSVPAESLADQSVGQASWMQASCDEPDALDRALRGVDAVINCAGPFQDTAPAVIEAALRTRAHYFDIAAEQRSVRQSLATFYEEALDKGLVVVPAMAFYGGLADLLVGQVCSGLAVVDKILIGVALDSWHPTLGTRRTGDRNTARRVIVANGRLSPLPSPGARGRWRFPQPFGELSVSSVPLSEVITISRHVKANQIESYMNEAPLADLRQCKNTVSHVGGWEREIASNLRHGRFRIGRWPVKAACRFRTRHLRHIRATHRRGLLAGVVRSTDQRRHFRTGRALRSAGVSIFTCPRLARRVDE